MRRWRARGAWLPRLARRWRPDGNPLRRTSDRIEAALLAILIAAFLCGAPLAGIAAGRAAAAGSVRAEHTQAGAHRVAAVLLQQAPGKPHPMFQAPLAAMAVAGVLAALGLLTRWVLDRRRLAAWDARWRATGPQWTGRQ